MRKHTKAAGNYRNRIPGKTLCVTALLLCLVLLSACGAKKDAVTLTVVNYGEYLDPDMLDLFTKETGIRVNYEEALTPEEMYTKYKSGGIEYDLVCSADYMLQRLIQEGELQKIDISALEHGANIGEKYWEFSRAFDPENAYTVPFFWGTVGILYDTSKVKGPVDSWGVLFDGSYAGEIVMQNSMRDSFMITLKYLGYSLNTTDENELKEAQALLLKQKPDVQAYLVDEARDEVVAGNATMAVVYSGEAYLGREYNPDLAYAVPKEGSNVWLDSWAVTRYCKDTDAAMQFLDFLCREDVAMANFEYIYFSTPNEAVLNALSDEERADETLVPGDDATKGCEVATYTDEATAKLMSELWKEIKAE